MADIVSKLHILIPILLCINIALSAVSQILAALGKKDIPVLSQIAVVIKKVVDFLSANVQH